MAESPHLELNGAKLIAIIMTPSRIPPASTKTAMHAMRRIFARRYTHAHTRRNARNSASAVETRAFRFGIVARRHSTHVSSFSIPDSYFFIKKTFSTDNKPRETSLLARRGNSTVRSLISTNTRFAIVKRTCVNYR